MSRHTICAQCEHFTLKDKSGEPLPQAALGIGACHGYDGHVTPVEPYVRWDAPYCVNFGRAKDWQKRATWIQQKRDADAQANAAAA
jgi:hypothetical protein